jgi:DNA-binding CsgD family transcriptional regulator
MSFEKIHETILNIFSSLTDDEGVTKNVNQYQKIDDLLNKFAQNDGSLKVIFDNVKLSIIATSNNLEALSGFTKNDLDEYNSLIFLQALDANHLMAPVVLAKWYAPLINKMTQALDVDIVDMSLVICGLSLILPNGKKMKILLRATPIEISESGLPALCIISIDDITHILKSNFYWGRLTYSEANANKFYYHSKEKKDFKLDILSDREKQVLKLIAEGKQSKEIAQELFLSVNTIDNHRKNAIARTGTKDTTALIQLCKILGIF